MLNSKFLLCVLLCIPLLLSAQGNWQTEQIPKSRDRNWVEFPDIAYSTDGTVHVIFGETNRQGTNLMYSKRNGSAWSDPVLIQSGAGGWYSSGICPSAVTADDNGVAHVVFTMWDEFDRSRLYYWNSSSGFGNPEEIITNIYTALSVSQPDIVADNNQDIHIAFFILEGSLKSVQYTNNSSGVFNNLTIIDPPKHGGSAGTNISIDLDNNVGVVFCRSIEPIPAARTYFSSNVSGTFITPVEVSMIPTDTSGTRVPEIKLSNGFAYITYSQYGWYGCTIGCDPGRNDLFFTKVNATTGEHVILPVPFALRVESDFGMDIFTTESGTAEVHVAYMDNHEVEVKKNIYWRARQRYLVLNGDDGSLLQQPETVYDQERVSYPSMELDAQGFAHLVFEGGDDPIYATNVVIPGGTMHISDVSVIAKTVGKNVKGIATVTILDEYNAPVPNVTVSGVWSGMTTDSDQFQTGSNGTGTAESDKVNKKSSGIFTFTVTDVSRAGWTYDPAANVEDSDSAPWNLGKLLAEPGELIPESTELLGNYPNPFNPVTTIRYQLAEAQQVSLTIFNISGEMVKQVTPLYQQPGVYEVIWDGTNASGLTVASGIYFYTLNIGNTRYTQKMTLNR